MSRKLRPGEPRPPRPRRVAPTSVNAALTRIAPVAPPPAPQGSPQRHYSLTDRRADLARLGTAQDPAWQESRAHGHEAGWHRITELARFHGGILSSAVCALLRSSARMSADAAYLARRAAEHDLPGLLKDSVALEAGARAAQRDAWELADRETQARLALDAQRGPGLEALLTERPGGDTNRTADRAPSQVVVPPGPPNETLDAGPAPDEPPHGVSLPGGPFPP